MKFKLLKNSEIDKAKWNEVIECSTLPQVYAQAWFLDIVSPGWSALIGGDYEIVMPIPQRYKMMIPVVVQPMFAQQLGVFSNKEISTKELCEATTILKRRFPFVVYLLNRENAQIIGLKGIEARHTYELNLGRRYEELLEVVSRSHRKNLNRAISAGISIVRSEQPHVFVSMLADMYRAMGLSVMKQSHYQNLIQIARWGLTNTNSVLYEAINSDGVRIGAAFFLRSGRQFVQFMARTEEGLEKRSAFALVNQLLVDYAGTDCYLDFAGSDVKGVAEFNAGWGADKFRYPLFKNQWIPLIK